MVLKRLTKNQIAAQTIGILPRNRIGDSVGNSIGAAAEMVPGRCVQQQADFNWMNQAIRIRICDESGEINTFFISRDVMVDFIRLPASIEQDNEMAERIGDSVGNSTGAAFEMVLAGNVQQQADLNWMNHAIRIQICDEIGQMNAFFISRDVMVAFIRLMASIEIENEMADWFGGSTDAAAEMVPEHNVRQHALDWMNDAIPMAPHDESDQDSTSNDMSGYDGDSSDDVSRLIHFSYMRIFG